MKFLKDNLFWILLAIIPTAIVIIQVIPTILEFGDGSFLKGLFLLLVFAVVFVVMWKALSSLLENVSKVWIGVIVLFVMVFCILEFREFIINL